MSNSHPEPGRARPGLFSSVPWREVLLANGFASVVFGAAALAAAARYSGRAHDWARAASADDFARVVRLAALVYLLYGLVTLSAGLVWLAVGVHGARRRAGAAGRAGAPGA